MKKNIVNNGSYKELPLKVYPNPIEKGLLHISYPDYANAFGSKVIIRDILGKEIHQIKLTSETTTYNIDKLRAEVYFLIIKNQKREIIQRFFKK